MTTTVKIAAHCSSNKQVRIEVQESDVETTEYVLADGGEIELYAYDSRVISVREVEKQTD